MPPYTYEAVPYRWTNREKAEPVIERWGMEFDWSLEDRADELITRDYPNYDKIWIQDRRNQLRMLDSFFSAVEPRRSLILFYAKDTVWT